MGRMRNDQGLATKVLRTVTYDSSSNTPDITARVITFVASDGTASSAVATTTLSMVATNDAPTASDDSYSVDEDSTLISDEFTNPHNAMIEPTARVF